MVVRRQLQEFQVRAANRLRSGQGRKLVIRVVPNAKASATSVKDDDSPEIESNVEVIQTSMAPPKKHGGLSRLWLFWLTLLLGLGGTVAGAFFWLATIPPQANCKNISPIAPETDRLFCAQQAAETGKLDKLLEAITFVQTLPPDHSLYSQARGMMEEWSKSILGFAQAKFDEGDLAGAIAIARKIPSASPFHPQVKERMQQWQLEWRRGEEISKKFHVALKEQKWFEASQLIQNLSALNSPYWDDEIIERHVDRMSLERDAWQQLEEARNFADRKTSENLAQAIALAGKVDSKSYVKPKAQADRNLWSQELIKIAAERFQEEDYDGALTAAKLVPSDASVYTEAQDWIKLGRSYVIAQQDNIFSFLEAKAGVREISPKSPLYQNAKDTAKTWANNLQDRVHMHYAETIANFDQPLAFQLAINQASAIAPQRPGRLQAQTLIAHWRKQIQQIEDRTALLSATQLATPGTLESLKAAVTEASKIKQGQPLRIEAQTYIAQWNKKVQTMEDQPILDLAKGLATQGNLKAAVEAAQKISPGRALYPEAQAALTEWVTQIQTTEDMPILDAAVALAAEGRLTGAINKASEIRYGRALYGEAQGAIARWEAERNAIWEARRRAAEAEASQTEDFSQSDSQSQDSN